jgi:cytochrome c oxidase cbb3-type subunit III
MLCAFGVAFVHDAAADQSAPQTQSPISSAAQDAGSVVGIRPDPATTSGLLDGERAFQTACSACHGVRARGGRNGAADLLVSPKVLGAASAFGEFVRSGNPPAGMPGFDLPEETSRNIAEYLKSLAAAASRRGNTPFTVTGSESAGKAFFYGGGNCTKCHSLDGDLKHIGSKYPPMVLQGRIVLPRGSGVHPGLLKIGVKIPGVTDALPNLHDSPIQAKVTLADGGVCQGDLLGISDFEVTIRDASGVSHEFSLVKGGAKVSVIDPAEGHIQLLGHISDQTIHDLTAYLATIK